MNKKVSIIIPCKELDKHTEKCIAECLKLNYDNFEILIYPDFAEESAKRKFKSKKVKIVSTGKVKPAVKRNLGIKQAKGYFLAFIDSDAYPEKNWLKNAVAYFKDKKIGVVGGPNLTPLESDFAEKISGYVLANYLVSGPASVRYKIKRNRFVKELPSCNYIARKEISPEYCSHFLTAEDSKFCFDIKNKGYEIYYAGDVVVYHHRRDTLAKHIKQMFIYGRDIAWLTKKEFSADKLFFSLLSIFVIGFFIANFISIFNPPIRMVFLWFLFFYLVIIAITGLHENLKTSFFTLMMSIATHFAYGIGFLYGIIVKQKQEIGVK